MSYQANDRSPSVHFQLWIQVLALYPSRRDVDFYWLDYERSDSNIRKCLLIGMRIRFLKI